MTTAKKASAKPAAKKTAAPKTDQATCGTCGSPVNVEQFEDRIEWSCPVCDKPKVDDDAAAFGFDKYSRTAD